MTQRDVVDPCERLSRRQALGLVLAGATGALTATTAGPASAASVHQPWDHILRATVTRDGWVDYSLVSSRFSEQLNRYLQALERSSTNFPNASAAKAFWLNAYNAVCVKLLLDEGLPSEVPHSKLFGRNLFTIERYRIGGKTRSLDEMEHEILRKRYRDNRIHAAVVCGASSCPRLRPEAYEGQVLDRQLDEECRSWIQRERTKEGNRKNFLPKDRKTYFASKIFDWYDEDFGGNDAGILRFIARFATAEDTKFISQHAIDVEFLDYSWRLNSR